MKARLFLTGGVLFLLTVFTLFITGCASSKPHVDWNSRVGNFTYDQAVSELGPPDKSAKLTDGKTVVQWIRRRAGGVSLGLGTGGYVGGGTAVGGGVSTSSNPQDQLLTLTFGPDNKLISWSKNY